MNRKFMSVKNCLLEKINTMAPNEKLPSERDLIEEFGFSRPTIQKALSDLENEGIIYRRPDKALLFLNAVCTNPWITSRAFLKTCGPQATSLRPA